MGDSSPEYDNTNQPDEQHMPSRIHRLKHTLTTRDGWIGDYDYKALCMPRIPCPGFSKVPFLRMFTAPSPSIFFGLHDHMPILVGLLMGFQHALAMVGGIIAVPRILSGGGPGNLNLEADLQAYLISTALIVSGLMSIIQIVRIKLIKGYWIGTGLISMSGISFTFLPVAQATFSALTESGFCTANEPCPDAYGRWLGTIMVGALVEIVISFVPPKILRKTFPHIVTGTTVFLIGASLVGVGLKAWAGGGGPCYDFAEISRRGGTTSEQMNFFRDCPNISGPGDRHYPWGSAEWIGLGFFVFSIIVIVEIFGSPFLRNTEVMIGLIAGIILSASLGYMDKDIIDQAPWITFPLVRRFNLGFYAPSLIPVIIAYLVSAVETIGDITAQCEVSRVETEGEVFESRIQGGLLADGLNSLIAGLLTSSPTTTFSQNNGVIAMTGTANATAGIWASLWLILMGMIGKIGGVFVALPDAALGGMTTFLFASVAVSGIRILSGLKWDRRERFILTIALSLGLGVAIVPSTFDTFIAPNDNDVADAFRQGVVIVLSSGYSVGAIAAMLLNLLIPQEAEAVSPEEVSRAMKEKEATLEDAEAGESKHI